MDHQVTISLSSSAESALTSYVRTNGQQGETSDEYLQRMCQKFVMGMLTQSIEAARQADRKSLAEAYEGASQDTKNSIRTLLKL